MPTHHDRCLYGFCGAAMCALLMRVKLMLINVFATSVSPTPSGMFHIYHPCAVQYIQAAPLQLQYGVLPVSSVANGRCTEEWFGAHVRGACVDCRSVVRRKRQRQESVDNPHPSEYARPGHHSGHRLPIPPMQTKQWHPRLQQPRPQIRTRQRFAAHLHIHRNQSANICYSP
jgi:hypothetical protein